MQRYIIIEAGEQVYTALCREAQEGGKPAPPLWRGFTYELCACLVDKAKSLPEIAAEEARLIRAVPPPHVLCSSTLPAVPQGRLAVRLWPGVHAEEALPGFGLWVGASVPHSCHRALVMGLGFWLSHTFPAVPNCGRGSLHGPQVANGNRCRRCAELRRIWDMCHSWPHPACHSKAQALRAPCTWCTTLRFMQGVGCSRCM